MSAFTGHLGLILYEDAKGRAILREHRTQFFCNPPLTYMVGSEDSGERITVPAYNPVGMTDAAVLAGILAGSIFITDLGSIPQVAWSLGFSPSGPEAKAFVLHDYGYARRGKDVGHRYRADGSLESVSYTRAQVDGLLLEAMGVLGCDPIKSRIIYDAVRLGGAKGFGS